MFVVITTAREQNKPQTGYTDSAIRATLLTRTDKYKRYDIFMSLEPMCTSTIYTKVT
jgi:hypothetical protein